MKRPAVTLLPGMDGTGLLFEPLLRALPKDISATPIAYPVASPMSYEDLVPLVRESLPSEPFVLVAESFSGPLSIMLAAAHPDGLRGLVLCSTFVTVPVPRLLAWFGRQVAPVIPWRFVAGRFPSSLLLGKQSPGHLSAALRRTVRRVGPRVYCRRLREVLGVDVRSELRAVEVPTIYLAGSQDRIIGRKARQQVEGIIGTEAIRTIDGPHLLMQCRPKSVAAEIARMCDDVATS